MKEEQVWVAAYVATLTGLLAPADISSPGKANQIQALARQYARDAVIDWKDKFRRGEA